MIRGVAGAAARAARQSPVKRGGGALRLKSAQAAQHAQLETSFDLAELSERIREPSAALGEQPAPLRRPTRPSWGSAVAEGGRPRRKSPRRQRAAPSVAAEPAAPKQPAAPAEGCSALPSVYPRLADDWNTSRNAGRPADVHVDDATGLLAAGRRDRTVHWQCRHGADHAWQGTVSSRIANPACPFCEGSRASSTNNLAQLRPEIAEMLEPQRNFKALGFRVKVDVRGADVESSTDGISDGEFALLVEAINAKQLAGAIGVKQHQVESFSWTSATEAGGECKEHSVLIQLRALELAGEEAETVETAATGVQRLFGLPREWVGAEVQPLGAECLTVTDGRKLWWNCPRGPDHVFEATTRQLASGKTSGACSCPFCANRKVSVTNSLQSVFPELASEWHPSLNGELTPDDVTFQDRATVWWRKRDPRTKVLLEWKTPVAQRARYLRFMGQVRQQNQAEWDETFTAMQSEAHANRRLPRRRKRRERGLMFGAAWEQREERTELLHQLELDEESGDEAFSGAESE